jgi:hypothetical protein
VPGTLVTYAGALVSAGGADRPWDGRAMKRALRETINATRTRPAVPRPYRALVDDPVVGPPAYAAAQAGQHLVPEPGRPPRWFEELATEPDRRAIAGLAAQVVRRDQEALMGVAWRYAAGLREVNELTGRARMAWEVAGRSLPRFQQLADETLLQVAGPALARLPSGTGGTMRAAVAGADLPGGLISGAFRRTCQSTPGLATRSAGALVRPTTAATRDFLSDGDLVARWSTVKAPGGADVEVVATAVRARPAPVSLADGVRAAIDPQGTVRRMLDDRISGIPAHRDHDAPAGLSVAPTFGTPMYARLAALGVEPLVPGVDGVPDNTLGLLEVNHTFVEAYLAALNHEMGREFRWREYPTPPDATWFRRFWDTVDGGDDIRPIDQWKADQRLGVNAPRGSAPASLVLLVTGPLLRRYPDVRVYAVEAEWSAGARVEKPGGTVALPVFTGVLRPGIAFFGFALTQDEARGVLPPRPGPAGYFFVLEEPPGAPRFGLDPPRSGQRGNPPAAWSDLSWAHLSAAGGPLAPFVDTAGPPWLVAAGELTGNGGRDAWGTDAAAMGRITVQQPVRMLVHADAMLP